MPVVTMPDGVNVSFPDEMPREQIRGLIESKFPQQTSQTTTGQEMLRPALRAARSGLSGLASVADIGGAAIPVIKQGMRSGLESLGVDFMGVNTPYVPPSQGVKNIFDTLTGGLAKPRTGGEQIVDVAGESMAGGGVLKGAQGLYKGGSELIKKLAPQTGAELASLAGAGAGAEIANQVAPNNPLSPIVGSVIGGIATVKGIRAIQQSGDIGILDKAYFNRQAQRSPDANRGYFENQATNILEKNLQASPDKLQSLKQQLQQDKNLVLPDIGGDEVRALTRQVGKYKGGARNDVDKFFTTRDKGAGQRLINVINSKVSGVDKYYNSIDELNTVRSELAKDQYGTAFDRHQIMKPTPSLDKFIQDGRFQSALADARKEGLIDIEAPVNSLRTLDSVYRRLRDKAGDFRAKNQNEAATVYGGFAKDFVKRLDVEAPQYKKARNTFAGFSNLLEAQQEGLGYLTKRPEIIRRTLKDMTIGEREAYKVGVREALEQKILTSSANADEALRIFGKPENRQQLKVILGDEYPEFSQKFRKEIRMADSKFKVLGGSRTDYNSIEDGQFIESATNIIKGGKTALVNEAINTLIDSIRNKYLGLNKTSAQILAKNLTSNKGSIKAIDDMIAREKSPSVKLELKDFKDRYSHLIVPTMAGVK
jgi:hypothetical protein